MLSTLQSDLVSHIGNIAAALAILTSNSPPSENTYHAIHRLMKGRVKLAQTLQLHSIYPSNSMKSTQLLAI